MNYQTHCWRELLDTGEKFWLVRFRIIRHLECSEQTPKETQPLQQSERKRKKQGSKSESLQTKGVQGIELKHNCRNKAKPKFYMKDIRKCHHPMHGAVSWTEGRTQSASGHLVDSSIFGMTLDHTLCSSQLEELPDFLSWNCMLTLWCWLNF